MNRDELIEAGVRALAEFHGDEAREADVAAVLDAVEPLIIRDVISKYDAQNWRHLALEANAKAVALMQARDDLRAKVEALPIAHHYGGERGWCVRIIDVLDLIDGSGDDRPATVVALNGMAELRAKVEALRDAANQLSSDAYDQGIRAALRQVLDLIGREQRP